MLTIQGYYFDGQNAKRVNATLVLNAGDESASIVIDELSPNEPLLIDWADIQIEAPLGNITREVGLGEERLFVTDDHHRVERLSRLTRQNAFPFNLVYQLEKNIIAVAVFGFLAIVFSWGMITYGIPKAAKVIAFELPESIQGQLTTSLEILDGTVLEPSKLSSTRQAQLRTVFSKHLQTHQALNPKIHFRSGIAANALALPNGDIVFTDDLVNLVEDDQELVAVLFHELGHLSHKHFTRRILQDSMITLVVILLTGDIDTVDIVTGIPTLVVDLAYSREFELEADKYAIQMLKKSNIPVHKFSIMIKHLAEHYDEDALHNKPSKISGFLSTHPHAQERIKQAEQYK